MIYGAVIAAVIWIALVVYTNTTLRDYEELSVPNCMGSLVFLEVCGVTIGAIVQLIQGTL